MIYPPIGSSSPEIKIKGFLKSKNQDVAIIPTEQLVALTNTTSPEVEKVLSVNIRSQLSSLSKNIDTLYERTFAEALNLHLSYPKQCLGEVYLIPRMNMTIRQCYKIELFSNPLQKLRII